MKYYTNFIWPLTPDSKVLEVWPWSWKFLVFLKEFYGLESENIFSVDLSKSVFNNISAHKITSLFNNNLWDTIEFLCKDETKFDLIVMKHVLEHMTKDYIEKLIPVLVGKLSDKWKILIEVPNMANFPLWYAGFFTDFSHMTPFTDISLRQAFTWNSSQELNINMYNLYIYPLNLSNPFSFLKSLIVRSFYYWFCKSLSLFYRFAWYTFEVTTTALLAIISKKQ